MKKDILCKIKVGNTFAIIDKEDEDKVNQYTWYKHSCGYAVNRDWIKGTNKKESIYMHRLITNAPKGTEVDHINMNRLDNRKENLRLCTKSQNRMNQKKIKGSSKYKGVHYASSAKKWCAQIREYKYKTITLGYFDDEETAARCWDQAAKKYYGEFVRLNFND